MASLQRHRSPCRSGELVTMCEHQGSSSPERSWSDDETSSNSTLNDVDEADERLSLSHTVNHDPTCLSSSVLFPFHLIAGCSSAERRTMCNLSGTLTSQEDRRVVEVKGTSTWAMHLAPQPAHLGDWTLILPSSLAPTPNRESLTRDHADTPNTQREPG